MATRPKSALLSLLELLPARLTKAGPSGAHPLLHEGFLAFAAAGDLDGARAMAKLSYGGEALPRPTRAFDGLGSGSWDGLSQVAGWGDLTSGQPPTDEVPTGLALEKRVHYCETFVRQRLCHDGYPQFPPPAGDWQALEGRDLWRRIQQLSTPTRSGAPPRTEPAALAAVTAYLDAWMKAPDARGAGHGLEVVLGLDLALRHGAGAAVTRWLPVLGRQLIDEHHVDIALCLPALARAISDGLLRDVAAVPPGRLRTLQAAIEQATHAFTAPAP